ncbi:hypothetical protein [Haloarcula pellucida]|uniref:Uncharacterized protein n=1 Tax=Haloarcula pellucida TaxID=1427151 RepID=A0A830GJF1_9EURY|nr:hypothetical protein [Halomicroarcula pellucida]MBX0347341.1 hypothetical protein [Halomicroarcula pellucida]GGN88187.1 hypothetical protein GCM10009030_07640 [Halomicroarcula pellucida]
MKRREFLQVFSASTFAASGCLSRPNNERGEIYEKSVTIEERGCGEKEHSGVIKWNNNSGIATIDATWGAAEKCGPLGIGTSSYPMNDGYNYLLDIYPSDQHNCNTCTKYFEYSASVEFRDKPSKIKLVHSNPEIIGLVTSIEITESGKVVTYTDTPKRTDSSAEAAGVSNLLSG